MSHRISIVKRSAGKSVVASLAYRLRKKLENELTGKTHDYTRRKDDVVYTDILLPEYAPERLKDPAIFGNELEQRETRQNAQLARSIFFALPRELSHAQNIELVKEIAEASFVRKGMCAAVVIHDKGDGNPHCHILLTLRTLNEDGTFGNKCRAWNEWGLAKGWMQNYQDITNKHLEQAGSSARIDVRTYEEQGIDREPTVHLGHYAHQLEQRGIESEQGNINRQIEARNRLRETLHRKLALLEKARSLETVRAALQHRLVTQLEALRKSVEARLEVTRLQERTMQQDIFRQVEAASSCHVRPAPKRESAHYVGYASRERNKSDARKHYDERKRQKHRQPTRAGQPVRSWQEEQLKQSIRRDLEARLHEPAQPHHFAASDRRLAYGLTTGPEVYVHQTQIAPHTPAFKERQHARTLEAAIQYERAREEQRAIRATLEERFRSLDAMQSGISRGMIRAQQPTISRDHARSPDRRRRMAQHLEEHHLPEVIHARPCRAEKRRERVRERSP